MSADDAGVPQPKLLEFTEEAREALDGFRQTAREIEAEAEGLHLSFLGKLPGLTVRIALILTWLNWACRSSSEPDVISASTVRSAIGFVDPSLNASEKKHSSVFGSHLVPLNKSCEVSLSIEAQIIASCALDGRDRLRNYPHGGHIMTQL